MFNIMEPMIFRIGSVSYHYKNVLPSNPKEMLNTYLPLCDFAGLTAIAALHQVSVNSTHGRYFSENNIHKTISKTILEQYSSTIVLCNVFLIGYCKVAQFKKYKHNIHMPFLCSYFSQDSAM
jgi:hypothetical protein